MKRIPGAAISLVVLVLYALSVGPAALIHARLTPADQQAFEAVGNVIYWPVIWMYHAIPQIDGVLNWYVRFWGGN